jgi:pimeloyl-ACP methyl ester carboxylesterase
MLELADKGFRVLAPFLRGYSPTKFLRDDTERLADQATMAGDIIDFFDQLGLENAIIVGQDWGSAIAEVLTFARQNKVSKLVKLNWHGVYAMAEMGKARGFNYEQMKNTWYIWMLNTPLGKAVTNFDAENFACALWGQWMPTWDKTALQTAFDKTKSAFASPDFGKIVLTSYRSGVAGGEKTAQNQEVSDLIAKLPPITCDVVVLSGADDPVAGDPLSKTAIKQYFTGDFNSKIVAGAGHFIHLQQPNEVIGAIMD